MRFYTKKEMIREETEILSDTLYALGLLAEKCEPETDKLAELSGAEFYRCIVGAVARKEPEVYVPALRLIGGLTSNNNHHVRELLQAGVLP